MLELPEWAASLHNGYNRPPQTLKEFFEQLGTAFQSLSEAYRLLGQALAQGYQQNTAQDIAYVLVLDDPCISDKD